MKILTAAICLVSVGILSGCVDDPGYRSGGYYTSGVYYRTYDRNRHYRDYDRRDWRADRGHYGRDRREWRDRRFRPAGIYTEYGVGVR
ncbi:hypothetical protein B0909_03135 [Rhizobium rhizogenes]|uniref:Lipoprotein n=1 Tax=Agrobacterium tumefaciens TaxID=358 RepID=A0A546XZ26_AGRTU|nr:hypothetical protein B0909_03135 [Rhizobium rhizogenes]TRB05999.1 hypothetical protein EXN61_12330 [Agrobacterium tumefaciens]